MVYGKPPDVSNLQIWGSICFGHVPKGTRPDKKLPARRIKCGCWGYLMMPKAIDYWVNITKNIFTQQSIAFGKFKECRDVMFDTNSCTHIIEQSFRNSPQTWIRIPELVGNAFVSQIWTTEDRSQDQWELYLRRTRIY